ncbi:hypothetical protein DXG01_004722, partial [Tephrocybe rancida]
THDPSHSPTPPPQQTIPAMTSTKTMLPRGHGSAPTFNTKDPCKLTRYFDKIEIMLNMCDIMDNPLMKQHATCYVDYDMVKQWRSLPQYQPHMAQQVPAQPPAVEQAVPQTYNMWKDALSGWLMNHNKLGSIKQDRKFRDGIRGGTWNRIQSCLYIQEPTIRPGDLYTHAQIKDAAKFILHGTETKLKNPASNRNKVESTQTPPPSTAIPSKNPPYSILKKDNMDGRLKELENSFATQCQALAAQLDTILQQNHSRSNPNNYANSGQSNPCPFCGKFSHYIKKGCLDCDQYVWDGKAKWGTKGRLVLPSGAMIPTYITGDTLHKHFEEYQRQNPGNQSNIRMSSNANPDPIQQASSLYYEVDPIVKEDQCEQGTYLTVAQHQEILAQEIAALDKRECMEAVKITKKHPFRNQEKVLTQPARQPVSIPVQPTASSSVPANSATDETPQFTTQEKQKQKEPAPVAGPSNSADPSNTAQSPAPIIGIDDTKRIFDFCLGTPITLLLRDLIKVSLDLHQKLQEAVTPKCVSNTALVNEVNEEELEDENIQFYASMLEDWQYIPPDLDKAAMMSRDPVEAYLSRISPGEQPGILSVAQESHSVHTIRVTVNGREEIDCIINSGSQIIAMSTGKANALGFGTHSFGRSNHDNHNQSKHEGSSYDPDCAKAEFERRASQLFFLLIEDVITDHGDVALMLEFEHATEDLEVFAYVPYIPEEPVTKPDADWIDDEDSDTFSNWTEDPDFDYYFKNDTLTLPANTVMTATTPDPLLACLFLSANVQFNQSLISNIPFPNLDGSGIFYSNSRQDMNPISPLDIYITSTDPKRKGVQVKKKYKPVALRTKPIGAEVPSGFRIE